MTSRCATLDYHSKLAGMCELKEQGKRDHFVTTAEQRTSEAELEVHVWQCANPRTTGTRRFVLTSHENTQHVITNTYDK